MTVAGYRAFGFQAPRQFLPSATNLCPDPLGINTAYWLDGTHIKRTADTDVPLNVPDYCYTKCVKYHLDGTAEALETSQVAFGASRDHYIGPLAYCPNLSGGNIVLSAEVYLNAAWVRTVVIATLSAADTDWVRRTAKVTTAGSGENAVRFKISGAAGATGDLYLTGMNIVWESVLTPPVVGGDANVTWAGPVNASQSTRAASVLALPVTMNPNTAGTLAMRFLAMYAGAATDTERMCTLSSGGSMRGTMVGAGGRQSMQIFDGVDNVPSNPIAQTWAANTRHTWVGRWVWASIVDCSIDGVDAAQGNAAAVAAQVLDTIYVGHATTPAPCFIGPVILSPQRKSDAWKDAIQENGGAAFDDPLTLVRDFMDPGDYLILGAGADDNAYRKTGLHHAPSATPGVVVFDGNSLTFGTGASAGMDYPSQTMALLGDSPPLTKLNFGVGGQKTPDMMRDAGMQIDAWFSAQYQHAIVCCWTGPLDATPYTITYDRIVRYCNARRAAGFKVVVVTESSWSSEATYNRTGLNALIRANWATFADALADVGADPNLGGDGDWEDSTYFVDTIHMTNAGYAIVAGLVADAIRTLL